MRSLKAFLPVIIIAALLIAVNACKKEASADSTGTVKISETDSTKTMMVSNGQTIALTLYNPGDGGYYFDAPTYSANILQLVDHVHTASTNPGLAGSFGTDTWNFVALKSGTTIIKVTATRPWANGGTVNIFRGSVTVK